MTHRFALLAAALGGLLLIGAIGVTYNTDTTGSFTVRETETPFTSVSETDSVGTNKTNASATVSSLLGTTTDLVGLDNTNATGAYYAKLSVRSSTFSGLGSLDVGIDNGTQTDEIVIASGVLTQTEGPWVRLEPGSSNTIYGDFPGVLGGSGEFVIDVHVADTSSGEAQVISRFALTIN